MVRGCLLLLAATLLAGCGGTKPLVDKPTFWRTIDGTITFRERMSLQRTKLDYSSSVFEDSLDSTSISSMIQLKMEDILLL